MENISWRKFWNVPLNERMNVLIREPNTYWAESIDDYLENRSKISYPFYKKISPLSTLHHNPNTAYILLDNVGINMRQYNDFLTLARIYDRTSELEVFWLGEKYGLEADRIQRAFRKATERKGPSGIDDASDDFSYDLYEALVDEEESKLRKEAFGDLQIIFPGIYPEEALRQGKLKANDRLGAVLLAHSLVDGLPYMKAFTKKIYPRRGKKRDSFIFAKPQIQLEPSI